MTRNVFDADALREMIAEVVREELRAAGPRADGADGAYLSVREAARLAAVSPGTIRAWIADGRLPRYHAGRELRVRRGDLDHLLATPPRGREVSPEEAAQQYLRRRAARAFR